jgi:hypothetical protein
MKGRSQPETRLKELTDPVAWVRRVNGRWIVHETLRQCAADYLDHLERIDPERLARSCRNARHLAEGQGYLEDPKPWFYAGLFSLATIPEAEQFLADHAFTLAAIPSLAESMPKCLKRDSVGEETWRKICRIRAAVAEVTADSPSR